MRISNFAVSGGPSVWTAEARCLPATAAGPFTLWYRFRGIDAPPDGLGDAMALGVLTPCMFEEEPVSIDGPLSPALLKNLARAQDVLTGWYDFLKPIQFAGTAAPAPIKSTLSTGVACAFSGGVDSWYSLLRNEPRITHLLLVRGFDVGLDNDALWHETRARAAEVATRLEKRLITCETNIRSLADKRHCEWGQRIDDDFWGKCLHGSALLSVALMLRHTIGEFIVPATHTYLKLRPWGSSPLLDHLLTNDMYVTHDGCGTGRAAKTRAIAGSDLALATLRVCYHNTATYNCGRCEKCLRTIAALRLYGALDRARTFPDDISLARIRRLSVPPQRWHHYQELLSEAVRLGDTELSHILEVVLGHRLSAVRTAAFAKRALRASSVGRHVDPLLNRLVSFASRRTVQAGSTVSEETGRPGSRVTPEESPIRLRPRPARRISVDPSPVRRGGQSGT